MGTITTIRPRPRTVRAIRSVLVIGCGLIGTSVALALRSAGVCVTLADRDPRPLGQAVRMGAGAAWRDDAAPAQLVVIATPPSAVAAVLREAQERGLAAVYTDVASTKARILAEAERAGCDLTAYVPGHPMAGQEVSGPSAARADLFTGRAWALCPHPALSRHALSAVTMLVAACGARTALFAADVHDRYAAAVSHAPLVVSAALAASFAGPDTAALPLAGQGLRDVTRIVGSPPELWRDILEHNAEPVADRLEAVAGELARVAAALRSPGGSWVVSDLLTRGNQGRGDILRAFSGTDVIREKAS
ncbi:MAG TPA: prephenate dehydrogenase [Nonomuraea sp.]|nr:prephenate dehydrogenase [Nonomuraea sp.]